jgi:hypothetical protein
MIIIDIMDQFLLYGGFFCAVLSLILCLYACSRVGGFIKASSGLDWVNIANITGDLASVKKTIQTLNNRLNGMNSPKLADQELMMQLLQNKTAQATNGKMTNVGG